MLLKHVVERKVINFLARFKPLRPYTNFWWSRTHCILFTTGWFRTFRTFRSVDRDGRPIPWLTYSAIDFLAERVNSDMTVFEYGAGNSTLWWAERVAKVVAVEHDQGWWRYLKLHVPENVTVHFVPADGTPEYRTTARRTGGGYQIILVDGASEERVNCAREAVEALAPDGIIICDDLEDPNYAKSRDILVAKGFRALPFTGLGPITAQKKNTTIFYRPGNCLGI